MVDSANSPRYRVTLTEHDSVEWTAGTFSRPGAYKRILMAASHTVSDWPHPTFAKVYAIHADKEVCVYTVDINTLKSAGCRAQK